MAIDPKELRIGCHIGSDFGMVKVYSLPLKKYDHMPVSEIQVRAVNDDCAVLGFDTDFDPIPITTELLTKLGFKYHEYDNGKLWEMSFPDLYKAYLYLELDENTESTYNFHMWNMKEYEADGRVQFLHELENWIYLMYDKELIND